ncbi:MAG: phytanoyl-CoA dioxygenase family protein [Verrucomicrobiae bacterium]|nr:phytanoyl-CoA dioxygenase family protein [Verrucomicrobiae bacterium]
MITDAKAVAAHFNEQGYAVVREVFSKAEVAEIERRLTDALRTVVPTLKAGDVYYEDAPDKPVKSVFRLDQHVPYFRQLLADERLLRIMREIFDGSEVMQVGTAFFAKAAQAGSVTPAHQDNAFQNLQPPEDLVCTIAIDESTPANGVLTVQAGSHRLGLLPHRASGVMGFSQTLMTPVDAALYPEVPLCMKPGDISLHHTNTIHRSGPNTTDRSRRQLGLIYRSARAKRDEVGWAKYQAELKRLHDQHPVKA